MRPSPKTLNDFEIATQLGFIPSKAIQASQQDIREAFHRLEQPVDLESPIRPDSLPFDFRFGLPMHLPQAAVQDRLQRLGQTLATLAALPSRSEPLQSPSPKNVKHLFPSTPSQGALQQGAIGTCYWV